MKEERENISQMPKSDKERTALLFEALKHRLKDAPDKNAAAVFASWDTAETAIFLYGIRKDIGKGSTKFDQLLCILDSRKEYDGLRFKKLILDLIDAFFDVFDAADFYTGLRKIDFEETPAVRIWAHTHALIRILDEATNEPGRFYHGFKLSKLDPSILPLVIHALLSFLNSVCHTNLFAEEFGIKELETNLGWSPDLEANEDDKIYFHRTLADVSLTLKELLTELRIREHEVYDQHPEWEIPVGDSNRSKDRQNQSKALRAYCEKYVYKSGVKPVRHFVEMANLLNSDEAHITDSLTGLKKLLETPPTYSYEREIDFIENAGHESLVNCQINPWIVDAKKSMLEALRAFCDRRANSLPSESKAGEHWLHVSEKIRSAYQRQTIEAKAVEIIQKIEEADEQESVERRVNAKAKARRRKAKGDAEDWRTWQKYKPRFRIKQIGDKISVADDKHIRDKCKDYPKCLLYEGIPETAAKIIAILIKQASSDMRHPESWWVKSSIEGKPFYCAFQRYNGKSTPAFEFKRDQIEVVRNEPSNPHYGEWRIRPNSTFKKNYKDFHRKDATLGS